MSTDYRLKIFRKCDNKLLGTINANRLKTIFDSEFDEKIHCERYASADKVRFTYEELESVAEVAFEKLSKHYDEITLKTFMISAAANKDMKFELEQDIREIKNEYITPLRYVIENTNMLLGAISCVVEDMWDDKDENCAYEYNAADLPKVKRTYGDGKEYEDSQLLFCKDIYCEIEADY